MKIYRQYSQVNFTTAFDPNHIANAPLHCRVNRKKAYGSRKWKIHYDRQMKDVAMNMKKILNKDQEYGVNYRFTFGFSRFEDLVKRGQIFI